MDYELVEKLKEVNASALVNSLLIKHFNSLNPHTMTEKEIRDEIKRRKAKDEYLTKLKEINNND